MDEATFQKELAKYKVVRRADSYKIRWNKNKKVERKVSDRPMISTNVPSVKKDAVPKDGAGFWDVVNSAPHQGIPTNEWSRFVNAMKQIHSSQMLRAVNLEDCEQLASNL